MDKIQRGNGVMNDNLAILSDNIIATKKEIDALKTSIKEIKSEVKNVDETISRIDKQNRPREMKIYKLLVLTVIISLIGLIVSALMLFR